LTARRRGAEGTRSRSRPIEVGQKIIKFGEGMWRTEDTKNERGRGLGGEKGEKAKTFSVHLLKRD